MIELVELNLWSAWLGVLAGMTAGAAQGLFFHRPDWLGGYGSWRRRLSRLGHISFFGLAFVNFAFAGTVWSYETRTAPLPSSPLIVATSIALIAGALLMPAVCYLSAWKKPFRHLFALPVGCLLSGVSCLVLWRFLP